jgi:hypothetical protein
MTQTKILNSSKPIKIQTNRKENKNKRVKRRRRNIKTKRNNLNSRKSKEHLSPA